MGIEDFKREKEGIDKRKPKGSDSYNKKYLSKLLQDKCKELGRTPTYNEINSDSNYPSGETYRKHFGSWNNALDEANLERNENSNDLLVYDTDWNSYSFGYIIGSMLGDGSLSNNCLYLQVTDKEFAEKFYIELETLFGKEVDIKRKQKEEENSEWKNTFHVRINSTNLFNVLYLYHSLNIKQWKHILEVYESDFEQGLISGLWDSEGSVIEDYRLEENVSIDIGWTNQSDTLCKLYIILLQDLNIIESDIVLDKFPDINTDSLYVSSDNRDGTYNIYIKRKHIEDFYCNVDISINRKREKIEGYLNG